jgi:hypothetical protein
VSPVIPESWQALWGKNKKVKDVSKGEEDEWWVKVLVFEY